MLETHKEFSVQGNVKAVLADIVLYKFLHPICMQNEGGGGGIGGEELEVKRCFFFFFYNSLAFGSDFPIAYGGSVHTSQLCNLSHLQAWKLGLPLVWFAGR